MNGTLFGFGYRRVCTDRAHAAGLLNVCLCYGISYTDFRNLADGGISFCVLATTHKRLLSLCREREIPLTSERGRGLPFLLFRYRRRAGLILGVMVALSLVLLSRRFVWDVRVKGNETMSEAEIEAELRACGFGVGSYIPDLSAAELENRVLIASDRISWISIHMEGTVAVVQVIEHTEKAPAPSQEDLSRPANLVAARDGQIEYLQLYRGQPVVVVGQAVKKGELLVSGIYDSTQSGYRYTRAAGMVMARTTHEFSVKIPLSYEEKVYSDPKRLEIDLRFFDFSMKIYKNSGNDMGACDIIKEEKGLQLFGGVSLPLALEITTAQPYTLKTATRSEGEALELAYRELDALLLSLSEDAQLLQKNIETTMTEDVLILHCTVSCIEDIAVQSEFEMINPS